MELFFCQAECGDAARIRYVDSIGVIRNILIDAGYKRTYKDIISDTVSSLIDQGEQIDLWVLSHIHADHIEGAIEYASRVREDRHADIVDKWYFNHPSLRKMKYLELSTNAISSAKSMAQANELLAHLFGTSWDPQKDISNTLNQLTVGEMNIRVLSPTKAQLQSLRDKYGDGEISFSNEDEEISEAKAAKQDDYHIKIEAFGSSSWKEDDSVENGSSISLLTELNGKRVLWLADAFSSTVAHKLKELGYSESNRLECDVVKVSHHGSSGNNGDELYSLIKCNTYVFSANGRNKHFLPNKECLAKILLNKSRTEDQHYTFYFTYDNSQLKSIFEVDGAEVFEKYNFQVEYNSEPELRLSL